MSYTDIPLLFWIRKFTPEDACLEDLYFIFLYLFFTLFLDRIQTRNIFEIYYIKQKLDHFPIDLEPNGRPFGSKSIWKG